MIAFKTFNECPEDQRVEGVSLNFPWIEIKITTEEKAIEYQNLGYEVVTDEAYERYKLANSNQLNIENIIESSMVFGAQLLKEFSAENVLLGITQENKTGEILSKLESVMNATQTGSLYEVLNRVRAIPITDYDVKYITVERLIKFMNKVEAYLGLPLTTEL